MQKIDVVMPIHNLIEYSNNYSKTSGSLWQYYGDEPNDNISNPEPFHFKVKKKKTRKSDDNKNVEYH